MIRISIHISPTTLHATILTVALCFVKLCIQTLCPPFDCPADSSGTSTSKQNQPTAQSIERLLSSGEEVRREPVRALADTIRDCNAGEMLAYWSLVEEGKAYRAAFFALGAGTRVVSHESCKFSPLYVPLTSKTAPKYRAPTLVVEMRVAQPIAEANTGMMIW